MQGSFACIRWGERPNSYARRHPLVLRQDVTVSQPEHNHCLRTIDVTVAGLLPLHVILQQENHPRNNYRSPKIPWLRQDISCQKDLPTWHAPHHVHS
jgi:hypothetical protein